MLLNLIILLPLFILSFLFVYFLMIWATVILRVLLGMTFYKIGLFLEYVFIENIIAKKVIKFCNKHYFSDRSKHIDKLID